MLDEDESIKVIVVGDGNVGKTCMLRRFVKGDFIEQYRKTIGAEFMEKDVFIRSTNTTVKLMLWDTAGQEVFNALTQAYYRGAAAAILAFSTVDRDSFMSIAGWKQRVESVCGPITMVLCQTKFDLSHEAVITPTEAEKLANQLEAPLFRVSTKDDFNVTQLFEFTAQRCMESAALDAGDEEKEEEAPKTDLVGEGEEPTAEASATAAPFVTTQKRNDPSKAATQARSAAAASPSLLAHETPKTGSVGGLKEASRPPTRLKNGDNRERGLSGAKNKVTLRESSQQGHHKKKRLRCSLY
ncbi:hypothetical protein LSCM1_00663 [Leishmania martiniquensis]|uniref:Small G-protein n=1 Tax=Leishmania martiniquensis TaxID=1580590 RepID=A0A836G1L4_9TRYP|nr:hypothetical protein LSCM1_00663 [Leishmania martiniquensis]